MEAKKEVRFIDWEEASDRARAGMSGEDGIGIFGEEDEFVYGEMGLWKMEERKEVRVREVRKEELYRWTKEAVQRRGEMCIENAQRKEIFGLMKDDEEDEGENRGTPWHLFQFLKAKHQDSRSGSPTVIQLCEQFYQENDPPGHVSGGCEIKACVLCEAEEKERESEQEGNKEADIKVEEVREFMEMVVIAAKKEGIGGAGKKRRMRRR
ncbi:hypothetical protein L873DRAFT_1849198 [Choiromyces venosus 120613-1]|uniref:Uncharacterized protein n=1 Tax=Choiromyces venosus 120613-1 TaxID=1336337 RepID=A0A3N4IXZ4_9PEZI|nr:hypothetical protein L873DRAFT_1849198 [Choiromyces venosus 120613-1]